MTPAESGGSGALLKWSLAAVVVLLAGVMLTRRGAAPTVPSSPASAGAEQGPAVPPRDPFHPLAEPTDDQVRAEVERLLFLSPALRDARLSVAVANGIVTLAGQVPSQTTADLAVSLASSVAGVRRVFNTAAVRVADDAGRQQPAEPPGGVPSAAVPSPPPAPPETLATSAAPAAQADSDQEQVRRLLDEARRQIDAGNHAAAAEIFQSVLRIDPVNPIAREALQRFRDHPPGPGRPPRP